MNKTRLGPLEQQLKLLWNILLCRLLFQVFYLKNERLWNHYFDESVYQLHMPAEPLLICCTIIGEAVLFLYWLSACYLHMMSIPGRDQPARGQKLTMLIRSNQSVVMADTIHPGIIFSQGRIRDSGAVCYVDLRKYANLRISVSACCIAVSMLCTKLSLGLMQQHSLTVFHIRFDSILEWELFVFFKTVSSYLWTISLLFTTDLNVSFIQANCNVFWHICEKESVQ